MDRTSIWNTGEASEPRCLIRPPDSLAAIMGSFRPPANYRVFLMALNPNSRHFWSSLLASKRRPMHCRLDRNELVGMSKRVGGSQNRGRGATVAQRSEVRILGERPSPALCDAAHAVNSHAPSPHRSSRWGEGWGEGQVPAQTMQRWAGNESRRRNITITLRRTGTA